MECLLYDRETEVAFATDCSDLVKMVSTPIEWPMFAVYLEEIQKLKAMFSHFTLFLISRTSNCRADRLTNCALLVDRNVSFLGIASMNCLPDEILIHILSFRPLKLAASTCILAKRWRTLFAFQHTLDFDNNIFMHDVKHRHQTQKSFRDFVERTLAFQDGLKSLSLKYFEPYSDELCVLDGLICGTLKHGLSELNLYIYSSRRCSLPSKLFTSKTLVKLSLGYIGLKSVPLDASLPALKSLFLDSVRIDTESFNHVFLRACPALEDLTLEGKARPGYLDGISSKTIKRLKVDHIDDVYDRGGIISLDTPNVVDLYYADFARPQSPRCNMKSLEKATLHLNFVKEDNWPRPLDVDVTDLISGICNVKTLHLTCSSAEVISVCCKGGLPVFNNLVELVFSSRERGWIVLLPLLLERSPNLKTLVLSGLERYTYGRRRFVGVPIPENNKVKMLRIMECQGSAREVEHIGHFLLKMEFLEVVRVCVAMDDPIKVQQLKKDLFNLPTASPILKIQVM